jgi:drug/metabolite transporter (DMT)-like permease
MGQPATGHQERPGRGILLVLLSTLFLASSDVAAKHLSASLPALQIAWMRYAAFTLIMLTAFGASRGALTLRSRRPGLQFLRGLGMVGSAILFISSLGILPVADATAISFISPILVTGLSVLILGERVGPRAWAAAFLGFAGVLVILRPGQGAFQLGAVLPVLAALCWAFALVATRRVAAHDSAQTTMTYSALVGLALLTLLVPLVWTPPGAAQVLTGAFIGVASTTGHWLVAQAYRFADASRLAPISFAQIVAVSVIAYLVLGAVPDVWTWAGAGIIAGSAVTMAREGRRAASRPNAS